MKKIFYSSVLLLHGLCVYAQNIGIGTTTPAEKLEVKNPLRSTLKISSNSYNDSSQLILSNRTMALAGTDFRLTSVREQGLKFSTASDIEANNVDSIMVIRPSGQIGINKNIPSERLDVNGNINLTGTIKTNGTDGAAGQVLMKNNSGNLTWGNSNKYNDIIGFSPAQYANGTTSFSWVVPANVTKIKVEAWGGGGGGSSDNFSSPVGACGGGGGGYITAEFPVSPGEVVAMQVGAGGKGSVNYGAVKEDGGITSVSTTSVILSAGGGAYGESIRAGFGGYYYYSPASLRAIGESGSPGETFSATFGPYGPTASTTAISMSYGNGGAAGNTRYSAKNGGFRTSAGASNGGVYNAHPGEGVTPGGGGGSGYQTGGRGGNGLVLIHY